MQKCSYCRWTKFWILQDNRYRCKKCRKTYRVKTKTYWTKTRISPYWKGRLLEYFCLGVPAYRLRFRIPVHLHTTERFYRLIRFAIYHNSAKTFTQLAGELEMDEAYFGGKRKRKRLHIKGLSDIWSGFKGNKIKQAVFGIYQRNGKVLTFPVPDRKAQTLRPLIDKYVKKGGVYYTDDNTAYATLSAKGRHIMIAKDVLNRTPTGKHTINGIEGFWSYAKHWFYPLRGVPKKYFHLYLKEIEWRFNNQNYDLVKLARGLMNQSFQGVKL